MQDITHISIYGRALAEAKDELTTVEFILEEKLRRKAQLEAFIANTEPLLAQGAALPAPNQTLIFPKAETPKIALPPQPIWKSIVLSINGKGNSFTVKDALEGLVRIGRGIESPNRFQIVRAVLTKKTETFEQIGPGLFAVRKQKEASEEAS